MATIRQRIEDQADDLLDQVFRLKKLKELLSEDYPEVMDLEVEGWITVSAYDYDGYVSITSGEEQDRALATRLLGISNEERITKVKTYSGVMRASFTFGDRVTVSVDRKNTIPCKKYRVVDKQVMTLSVCGEVDTDRYDVLEEIVEVPEAA